MNDHTRSIAQACLDGAERNTMTFPQIVDALMRAGFESYAIDFRRAVATYYLPDGETVELTMPKLDVAISANFDALPIQGAIKEAQQLVPGYTYAGFCRKIASAGCAGYVVSFCGRRALYVGRTAETHVEHFPN